MDRPASRGTIILCAFTGILAAAASGAGVFLRGDLATTPFVTVRGEEVDVLTGGTYRFNGLAIAAEGVGWDFVTLFLVVPFFFVTLVFMGRGSLRATLAAMGVLAYLLYQFAEYAMYLAYGPLFLLYVATFSLSLVALAILAFSLGLEHLGARFSSRFPRRGIMGLGVLMAVLLTGMWLPMIARSFGQGLVEELDGATTLVVQAFDLGFLVPLGLFTAYTVYRWLPVGYVLSAIVVVKAMAMATAIFAMLAFEYLATGELALPPMIVFAGIALIGLYLAVRVYASVGTGRQVEHAGPPHHVMAHPSPAD
jgi:hypothetical protein